MSNKKDIRVYARGENLGTRLTKPSVYHSANPIYNVHVGYIIKQVKAITCLIDRHVPRLSLLVQLSHV